MAGPSSIKSPIPAPLFDCPQQNGVGLLSCNVGWSQLDLDLFMGLFLIALNKMALVSSLVTWDGLNWTWTFPWARQLRPRDEAEKAQLLSLLSSVCLDPSCNDNPIRAFHKSGIFSNKSFSAELDKASIPAHHSVI